VPISKKYSTQFWLRFSFLPFRWYTMPFDFSAYNIKWCSLLRNILHFTNYFTYLSSKYFTGNFVLNRLHLVIIHFSPEPPTHSLLPTFLSQNKICDFQIIYTTRISSLTDRQSTNTFLGTFYFLSSQMKVQTRLILVWLHLNLSFRASLVKNSVLQ
jgi:hypothetical protein